ncbi:hypothetical protein EUGRSUZ_B00809 [Eucalyptus grandis]|uniref:Uncharacterized protein n=2 Tax=Eucalyptus grandis TaxID=71139 RepID=A0ACC3LN96_EUCGR|nr:hypothetical protein EUGRSUZ_B00809 [Eucalyptus grandis]
MANVVEEFAGAMREGFVLDWETAKECRKCQHSGRQCVFNKTEHALCFCNDGSIHVSGSFCEGSNEASCAPFDCGHQQISYPFKHKEKPSYCGYLGHELRCYGYDLALSMESLEYRVRMDLWEDICLQKYVDTTLDLNRYNYTYSDLNVNLSYNCKLQDGQLVAVKLQEKLKNNAEEFFNEIASISKTSHVNVVNLLGFCFEGTKRVLVYEYMPNGSLEKLIFDGGNTLDYLHRGCNTRILHFDIKPHSIFLYANYCPKVSNFGLAKICPRQENIVSIQGTWGTLRYIALELFMRSIEGASHKLDVYSYDMMVLEMV